MTRIVTIDAASAAYREESVSEEQFLIGGRALSSSLVATQVPPAAHPLGPFNILAFCGGVLAGTAVSNANRLSVGGKSPLTSAIKESNSGGTFAYQLGRLRIRALVLKGGRNDASDWHIVVVDGDGVRFEDGSDCIGLGCHEKAEVLKRRYGDASAFAMIGPAAEHLMCSAAIAVSDPQYYPARFCGRGGLGAVMASKGVQAIVVDGSRSEPIRPVDPEAFKQAGRNLAEQINTTPQTAQTFRTFGTAAMVDVGQGLGFLPVRNFSRGRFDGAERVNGQALYDTITRRGGSGNPSHSCMPGCLIKCSNIYPDRDGNRFVSPVEYETIGMMGPNLGIDDLDAIAGLNYQANDIGIDTIETGAAIGVAMQAGIARFGDREQALDLIGQIGEATPLGRILGAGAETCARVFGVYQAPVAKGQSFPAYDPRALKGMAVTYATSPMGADHTAGITIRSNVKDHHAAEGQAAASRAAQLGVLQWDSLGFCTFIATAVPDLSLICDLIKAVHGREFTPQQIRDLARTTLITERSFNRDAGFGPAHDRLSEFFHCCENPDTRTVCDIPEEDVRDVMDDASLDR